MKTVRKKATRVPRSRKKQPETLPDFSIPLWEEDYSAVRKRLDALSSAGVVDWRTYLESHPEEVHSCLSMVRVRDVNPAALALFQYDSKRTFLKNPPLPCEKEWRNVMREELVALAEGRRTQESDLEMKTFDGEPVSIRRRVFLAEGCEADWSRVIVEPVNVSTYKKKAKYLLTEVEWGSFLLELYEASSRLTEQELFEYALRQAVHFTDSRVGFFHVLSADQESIVLKSWVGELAVDLTGEVGIPVPVSQAGMWADCVRQKRPVICRGSPAWNCIQGMPPGSMPVRRLLSLPVLDGDEVVCVLGVGNKESPYQTRDMAHIQLVAYGLHRILKQRRAVEALTQSEELFRLLTQHFPFPIAVFHERGRAEFINERFLSTFGYGLDDIPDQDSFWRRLLPDGGQRREVLAAWEHAEEAADRDQTDAELDGCRIRTSDNRERIVDVIGARIHGKRLLLLNDVTEHKRAEEETLRRTEELEILAKISTAMRVAQSRSEIYSVLVNQLAVLMKAEGAAIALRNPETGGSIVELGSHSWERLTGLELPAEENPADPSDFPVWRKNGHMDTASAGFQLTHGLTAVAHAPLIAGGQVIGTIWIGRSSPIGRHDIRLLTAIGEMAATAVQRQSLHEDLQIQLNALRQAQARLVQSEKLAAIGQLAAGIAHELNNPLTSVVLYSQLVQQEKLGGAVQANLEKVVSEALRAGKIVRGLLDFARQRPIHREPVQVNEAMRNSMDLIAYEIDAGGVEVLLDLAPNLPTITADLYQLTQVFMNLIQNSIQAMHAVSGRRELRIATVCGPSNYYLSGKDPRTMVRISFRDTGPGIPHENLSRIFDPFFTTKPEGGGTGLGLSICHGIVGEHDGHIWVESSIGEGSTFFVELPVAAEEEENPPSLEEHSAADPGTGQSRILIIDDEPNVQDVLAKALTNRGYVVETAGNGQDGLVCLAESEFDVILCDFRMPGLSGMDFFRRIQSERPYLAARIIFITGDTANLVTRHFIEENDLNILEKPFELRDLIQVIRLIGEKESHTPGGDGNGHAA
ncbi:MAG: GAF domain-containing protein [Anaerolineales bacterium]|nr:GAF domain-containing protein [Anaerolineales bacterium]